MWMGAEAGLPTTSRYCRTTLLGSGPSKTYTSRIPPVDLQLRAGLGCRTTSGGSSPGAQGQIPTCPPGPLAPHGWTGQTDSGERVLLWGAWEHPACGVGGLAGEPGAGWEDAEQLEPRAPLSDLCSPPERTLGSPKGRAGEVTAHGTHFLEGQVRPDACQWPLSCPPSLSGQVQAASRSICDRWGCSCIWEARPGLWGGPRSLTHGVAVQEEDPVSQPAVLQHQVERVGPVQVHVGLGHGRRGLTPSPMRLLPSPSRPRHSLPWARYPGSRG